MDYRILSLDGGGTWALIQVKALMSIYGQSATGHTVLKNFDLVAANSGGSIVLAALACDLPLNQILQDFKSESWREKVFVPIPWWQKINPLRWALPMPKYLAAEKFKGLRNFFNNAPVPCGDSRLTDLPAKWGGKPHLLITSFDYDRERAVFFRTNKSSPARSGTGQINATLAEAVHASTNAPVKYFDEPAAFADHRFWDGAMAGLNNPVLCAVTEALSAFDPAKRPSIKVRTIGTGSVFLPLEGGEPPLVQKKVDPGYITDIGKTAICILDDPPDQATFMAYTWLDGKFTPGTTIEPNSVVRLSPLVQPIRGSDGRWHLPGHDLTPPLLTKDEFEALTTLSIDPDQEGVLLIERLCDGWLADQVPNQPIRANSDTFECEIGHRWFSSGKSAW